MAKAIVGLGNPGPEYERTRHNAGWMLLDHLVARWGMAPYRRAEQAVATSGTLEGVPVRLVKPNTYMNRSGDALRTLRGPAWDPASDLLVLVDDVALPPGRFRLRGAGSAGGHNGLKSIEGALRRQDYARLRIGVGAKPPEYDDLADWVLGRFTNDERATLDATLDQMADAVACWVHDGIEIAMTRFNKT
ncbi:MAG: aminoacyl-tRNA hydrolase [Gemmatimonadales bacterium]